MDELIMKTFFNDNSILLCYYLSRGTAIAEQHLLWRQPWIVQYPSRSFTCQACHPRVELCCFDMFCSCVWWLLCVLLVSTCSLVEAMYFGEGVGRLRAASVPGCNSNDPDCRVNGYYGNGVPLLNCDLAAVERASLSLFSHDYLLVQYL